MSSRYPKTLAYSGSGPVPHWFSQPSGLLTPARISAHDVPRWPGSSRRRTLTLDRQLWLVIRLNPREGLNHRLYFPKANITSTSGRHTLTIRAHCPSQTTRAGVGNSRTLMIVSADVSAVRSLQRNYDADQACDPGFDNSPLRRRLPTGAVVISNQGNVTRT